MSEDAPLTVVQAAAVEGSSELEWLVEDLWLAQGVGVLGGAPKACKSWVAAELAMAVSSGCDAFGRYRVCDPGPVLFYGAEDSQQALRTRFEGIATQRAIKLAGLPLFLLDVTQLRLDQAAEVARLSQTVAASKARLLVLDPFVRLARVDENSASEVSAVLGALRDLQRERGVAILLVHHARKASGSSPTLAFRGTGDFGAWGDSNLPLTRRGEDLKLGLEHRSAAAPAPLRLRLLVEPAPHLALLGADEASPALAEDALQQALLGHLAASPRPHSTTEMRERVRRRKADVVAALAALEQAGLVTRATQGWTRREIEPDENLTLFPP